MPCAKETDIVDGHLQEAHARGCAPRGYPTRVARQSRGTHAVTATHSAHRIEEFALESWMSQSRLVVNVSGTADMNTMLAFGEALVQVHEEVTAKSLAEVCLDLHKVYFLNSTCLKNITTLALRAKDTGYRIVCRISARLSWQRRALDPIVRLAQGALVLEETSE